jgi:hypothetical protein
MPCITLTDVVSARFCVAGVIFEEGVKKSHAA